MIKILIWMIVLALFQALEESQIEGKSGWARHLPTFRISNKITKLLLGKELTGYHLYMILMFLIIFHGIFLFYSWTLNMEIMIVGLLNIYFVIEDYLFFIINPHFGYRKFNKKHISWHKRWAFGLPITYWWGLLGGITLLIIGGNK